MTTENPTRPSRTRRITMTAFGLAAATTAVVLIGHNGSSPAAAQAAPVTSPAAVGATAPAPALENASYDVALGKDGTVRVQLAGAKLSGLQAKLRQAGLPAVVLTPSASCNTRVVPADVNRLDAVMSLDPKNGRIAILHPSAIPHGDTLLVVNENSAKSLHKDTAGNLSIMLTKKAPACFPASQVDIG